MRGHSLCVPLRFSLPTGPVLRLAVVFGLLVCGALFGLLRPGRAAAHPLGNFTINRYARVEAGADTVRVVWALDMAEIPTFQEMNAIDRDRNGVANDAERATYLEQKLTEIARNLRLTVNGTQLTLRAEAAEISFGEGQGGLALLRIDASFAGDLPANLRAGVLDAQFRDTNYDNRLGWKEIVVRGTAGAAIRESTALAENTSDELRSYPDDSLQSPLDVREARFRFELGVAGATGTQDVAAQAAERTNRAVSPGNLARFADAAATKKLTVPVALLLLAAATFWGAVHALGPGHGKTVVAAYLVGSRGTARHALLLGLTVTATHTASTYLLGFATLSLSAFIVPERVFPILSLASGLMVLGMGLNLLLSHLRGTRIGPFRRRTSRSHGHEHDHEHEHGHEGADHHHGHDDHDHSHALPGFDGTPVTWRSLLALGVYGGMIPCPTAIVVLLISISLNRVGFGLALVVAFSLGLAAVLTGIGIALVYAGRRLSRLSRLKGGTRVARAVPVMSAAAVIVAGLLITLRAAGQTGLPIV